MCVFVLSVIYSEARSASSCPTGVPMTLPAADLHHREREEDGEMERSGGGRGRRVMNCGKINIVFQSANSIRFATSSSFSEQSLLQGDLRTSRGIFFH